MRISQLSERAALPIGTVKFYLRTGLLPAGRPTSATQAEYDESHLERLRLIRALLEVGSLSHAQIQRILDAIDTPAEDPMDAVQLVNRATATTFDGDEAIDLTAALELLDDLGWQVPDDCAHLPGLAQALAAADAVGLPTPRDRLRVYAEAAAHVARSDLQMVFAAETPDRPGLAATSAVLYEAILASLRRLAAEHQVIKQRSGVPSPRVSLPGG